MTSTNPTMRDLDRKVARDTIIWNLTRWFAIVAVLVFLAWLYA